VQTSSLRAGAAHSEKLLQKGRLDIMSTLGSLLIIVFSGPDLVSESYLPGASRVTENHSFTLFHFFYGSISCANRGRRS